MQKKKFNKISYYKSQYKMNRMDIRKKDLKDRKIISGATINKMKNNEIVTTESIDKLCEFFQCQPGDILEFIPNKQKMFLMKKRLSIYGVLIRKW